MRNCIFVSRLSYAKYNKNAGGKIILINITLIINITVNIFMIVLIAIVMKRNLPHHCLAYGCNLFIVNIKLYIY